MKILLVEDEVKVARAVEEGLRAEHYDVGVAHTGEDGFFRASTEHFDLCILDVMLPGRSGIEILKALRQAGNQTPVLILTARDAVEDRVVGLDGGADDYLIKPFAFAELLARIRALLRRGRPDQALRLRLADLEVDCITRAVTRAGHEIQLTAKEYDLLEYLMRHQRHIVSRNMLAQDVWKIGERATPLDNVIDVHIAHLRRKLDDGHNLKLLRTVRGVGFVLEDGVQ